MEANKIKLIFKWVFAFSILIIWTFFVAQSMTTYAFEQKTNSPIYIQIEGVTQKATTAEILNYLFNHNFQIEYMIEQIPADSCSVRAKDGNVNVQEDNLGSNNDLSFSLTLPNAKNGQGSLTAQKSRKRFSFDFEINRTIQNDNLLKLEVAGEAKYNKNKFNTNAILTFDKENKKVSILGNSFSAENLEVSFIKGCLNEQKEFYLLTSQGKLEERRSIAEVRALLAQHHEFQDNFENLRGLYKDYWWLTFPGGFAIVS